MRSTMLYSMFTSCAATAGSARRNISLPTGSLARKSLFSFIDVYKRQGIATKLVVVILIVYAVVTLINLQTRIDDAEREKAALAAAVADKSATNEALRYEIEHSGDPATLEEVARDKLGLVLPGEQIFYDIGN